MSYPQYPQQYQQYPAPPPPGWGYPQTPAKHSGLAIASMVVGIVSLVFGFIPFGTPLMLITGIVGLPMAITARVLSKQNGNLTGCATAGIWTSSISLVVGILMLIQIASTIT